MLTTTISEFRAHQRKYIDAVESGKTVEIYRKGKPVARLTPCTGIAGSRWKTSNPLKIPGVSFSKAILADRRESC